MFFAYMTLIKNIPVYVFFKYAFGNRPVDTPPLPSLFTFCSTIDKKIDLFPPFAPVSRRVL